MATFDGLKWDISRAVWSGRDDDGHPLVQEKAYGDDIEAGNGNAAFHLQHAYGSYSRPHDPAPGNNGLDAWCTLLVAQDGSTYIGFLGYDPRFIGLIPLPPKGSQMNYAAFQENGRWRCSFDFISGDNGTKQFYLPIGDSSLSVTFGLTQGKPVISFLHPDGSLVSMYEGEILLKSPSGENYIQVSDKGIVLKGSITQQGGLSTVGGVTLTRGPEFATFASNVLEAIQAISAALASATPSIALTDQAAATAIRAAISAISALMTAATTAAAVAQTAVTRGS